MIGTRVNNRYQIDGELGQGGMGTVYKGFDSTLERDVAIKMMTETRLGTEGRNRLLHEAKAIAKLSHLNIITVFDAGEFEQSPYIVMEYVEGVNLYDEPPKDIEEIILIMKQVCAALSHAHEHGIIHRDLKPENVILTPNGTVKLMDFGLARSLSSRLTSEGTILGTVFYLAPEQAQGHAVDPRSDLYSLGVMMYELVTGELPFLADDPLAVVSQHIHAPVVPPRAKNANIPPALEVLILQLMRKDPAERPACAQEVFNQLSLPEMLDVEALPAEELSVLDRIVRGRLVGREQELKQALQAWQKAMASQGQLLLVSGEPGVGKTRLMREVVTHAEVSGGQTFIGESQAEGNAPYAAFAQIIRRALRSHQNNGLELPDLVMAELISIAPELRVDYPEIAPNPALEPESEQRRLFECVFRFFSAVCAGKSLLLVLEDIHWADSGTLSLLQFLARRCREHPVMLLGTYREVELDDALPFHQTLLDLNRKNLGTRLKLERLDQNKTRDMLGVIFAEEIKSDFLAGIFQETEGNPFFIEEVCKALIESGQVYFDGEIWQRPPDMADIEIPQSIKVAVQSRVIKLSESAQDILLNAAVIGREFGFELLQKVTGKEEDDLIEGLEAGLKAQLIEEVKVGSEEIFSFSHALIPTALRDSLSGMRRTRLHCKIAQVMDVIMPDAYQRLAYHWREGGNLDRALDYTIRAAEMAKKTYANEDAIRLYSEALDIISEEDDRRFDLLSARVSLNDLMGNREDQLMDIESMIEIAEKENNKQKMADALIEMASFYVEFDPGKARDPSEKALKISHSMDDFSREGNACFLLSQHFRMVNDLSNSRDYLDQAISITRKEGLTSQLVEYLSYLSKISHLYEEKEIVLNAANEALFLSKTINDKRLLMVANLAVAIVTAQLMKDYIQAVEFAKESLQFAEEISDVTGELSVLNFLGLIYHELGNLEKAEPYFLRMLEPSLLFTGHYTIYGLFNLNNLYVSMGEYEKSYLIVEKMLNLARPTDNDYMITEILFLCALACYQLGDYKNAIKYHEEVWLNIQDSSVEGEKARVISMFGILTAATDDHKSAYKYIEKGQRICEGLLDDKAYKAHVFRNSAQVARMIGNTSEIKDGLEKVKRAIDLLQEIQTNDGWPYFVRAGLHLLLVNEDSNHAKEALNSLEIAFDWRKKYPVGWWSEWTNEMIFLLASNVYRANNLILKADEYLQKAYDRVMLVAGKIQDDELRRSFLENVKDNREILQEAKARGITFE